MTQFELQKKKLEKGIACGIDEIHTLEQATQPDTTRIEWCKINSRDLQHRLLKEKQLIVQALFMATTNVINSLSDPITDLII